MVFCAAYNYCINRYGKTTYYISFHKFPTTDPSVKKSWLVALKRENFQPTLHSKLCSEHFLPADFIINFGRKTLKSGAVPSIFHFPEHLVKKVPPVRSLRLNRKVASNVANIELESPSTSFPSTSKSRADGSNSSVPKTLHYSNNDSNSSGTQLTDEISQPTKRKRSVPVYVGDIKQVDNASPRKRKFMWQIANKTIKKQQKTIKYLRTQLSRSLKKG